jgi:hypothetical protein
VTTDVKVIISGKDNTRAAADSAKRNLAGIQATATRLNAVMGSLASVGGLGALAGGLSAGAFVGFVKGVTDSVDALNDFSDATGTSVENASALIDIATRTGTAIDAAETAVVKLNQALNSASDPNSDVAGALKSIGLSAEELKKLDPAEALLEVAKALDKYENSGGKARAIQVLLGKSARELAPYLKDLAEKGELNAKVTTAQAEEAEKFNKQLFALQTNVTDAARAIGLAFLPAINGYIERVQEAFKVTGGYMDLLRLLANGNWSDAFKIGAGLISPSLGPKVADVRKEVASLNAELEREQKYLADLQGRKYLNPIEKDDAKSTQGTIARLQARIDDAKKRLGIAQSFEAQLALEGSGGVLDANDARARAGDKKPTLEFNPYTPPKGPKAKDAKDYDADLEMSRRAAEAYAATLGKLTDSQADAEQSTLTLTPSQRALRDLMADPVWQTMPVPWQQTAIAQTEAAVAAEKSAADLKRLNDLVAATPSAQLEKQREEMQFLAEAFERGKITAEQFSEAAGTALGTLPKLAEDAAGEMDQFMVQAARNIQDAFADFLFDPFKDGVDGLAKNFGQVIQRMIAQAVAADLGKRLFGADLASGKSGAQLGGWLGDLLDQAKGVGAGAAGADISGGLQRFWASLTGADTAAQALAKDGLAKATESAVQQVTQGGIKLTADQQATAAMVSLTGAANTAAAALTAMGAGGGGGGGAGSLLGAAGNFLGAGGGAEAIANALPGDSLDNFLQIAGLFHTGGVVGAGGQSRAVPAGVFAQARRFHSGGIPGLAADEVPAILKRREEVLTESDPRHVANGGRSAGVGGDIHINITVPPGTPAEQRASLAQQARAAMGALNRARRYG